MASTVEMEAQEKTNEEEPTLELPAPAGWKKKLIPKKGRTSKKNEIIFTAPTGEEFKTKRQLEQYLKSHPESPSISEFDWGMGETPRRSTRISEKAKEIPQPEAEPPKKKSRSSSKKDTKETEVTQGEETEEGKEAGMQEAEPEEGKEAGMQQEAESEGGKEVGMQQAGTEEGKEAGMQQAETDKQFAKENQAETNNETMQDTDTKSEAEKLGEQGVEDFAVQGNENGKLVDIEIQGTVEQPQVEAEKKDEPMENEKGYTGMEAKKYEVEGERTYEISDLDFIQGKENGNNEARGSSKGDEMGMKVESLQNGSHSSEAGELRL